MPVIELLDNRCEVELFPFMLLQFSFDIVIGCVPADKHFESMGTETGEEQERLIKRLDKLLFHLVKHETFASIFVLRVKLYSNLFFICLFQKY